MDSLIFYIISFTFNEQILLAFSATIVNHLCSTVMILCEDFIFFRTNCCLTTEKESGTPAPQGKVE